MEWLRGIFGLGGGKKTEETGEAKPMATPIPGAKGEFRGEDNRSGLLKQVADNLQLKSEQQNNLKLARQAEEARKAAEELERQNRGGRP